jgi:cell wall-associated NlpC family hydrolase
MREAKAVSSQINQMRDSIEVANENYNSAAAKQRELLAQSRVAARHEAAARKRIGVLQKHLGTRASDMYRDGQLGFLDVLLGAKTFDALATTWDVLRDLNRDDAKAIAETKVAKAEAAAAHEEYATKERAAAQQAAIKRNQLLAGQRQQAALQSKEKGIKAEIAAIDAAAAAASRLQAHSYTGGAGAGDNYPDPTIPAHGSVVAYARSRLGCPYVWAASGPRAFDCSGLMAWCYRQIGISLPHSSRAQIGAGQRVSRANLQPGDLVFFGSPIHHVGMYIGGGMMIEAPYTGARVRVAGAFRSDYAGACRP